MQSQPGVTSQFRVLVTGAAGFVGRYLVPALVEGLLPGSLVLPTARKGDVAPEEWKLVQLDVTDTNETCRIVADFSPTHVFHLAAVASPTHAARNPRAAWETNFFGTRSVADALRQHAPEACFIVVTSGLIYGATGEDRRMITEADLLAPSNEYAVSKAAVDLLAGSLARQGMNVIRLRPFNHIGPGQPEDYVVSGLAARIARMEKGGQPGVLRVGSMDAHRDFLDVRDVVDAYVAVVRNSPSIPSGSALNVSSGTARQIREIVDRMVGMSRVPLKVAFDSALARANDSSYLVGCSSRLRALVGWAPKCDLDDTLAAVLDDWRHRVTE
jgi:GDP-4-dehydro-6-deoxy-D-mannose reductase